MMNERLKELIDQCINERLIEYDGGGEYVEVFDKEKFAELLVRECCEQFAKHPYVGTKRTQYIYGYIQGRVDAEQQIKQHFGVEQ
jgi:hypothetical protein